MSFHVEKKKLSLKAFESLDPKSGTFSPDGLGIVVNRKQYYYAYNLIKGSHVSGGRNEDGLGSSSQGGSQKRRSTLSFSWSSLVSGESLVPSNGAVLGSQNVNSLPSAFSGAPCAVSSGSVRACQYTNSPFSESVVSSGGSSGANNDKDDTFPESESGVNTRVVGSGELLFTGGASRDADIPEYDPGHVISSTGGMVAISIDSGVGSTPWRDGTGGGGDATPSVPKNGDVSGYDPGEAMSVTGRTVSMSGDNGVESTPLRVVNGAPMPYVPVYVGGGEYDPGRVISVTSGTVGKSGDSGVESTPARVGDTGSTLVARPTGGKSGDSGVLSTPDRVGDWGNRLGDNKLASWLLETAVKGSIWEMSLNGADDRGTEKGDCCRVACWCMSGR